MLMQKFSANIIIKKRIQMKINLLLISLLSAFEIAAHSQVVGPYSATPGGETPVNSASQNSATSPGLGMGANSSGIGSNQAGLGSNTFGMSTNQFQTNSLTPTGNTNGSSRVIQNAPLPTGGATAPARQ
jgi:hypothetical protein